MSRTDPRQRPVLALVVIAVLALLAACGDDDGGADAGATTTSTDTTGRPTPSPTTDGEGGAADEEVAAVLADGRTVLVDRTGGEVVEVLLEGIDVSDPATNDISVSPDSGDVFVVRPASSTGDHEIVRVPAGGGEADVVTTGLAPAVSPDGSTLAYVDVGPVDARRPPDPAVVLHDLATGDERRLERVAQPAFYYLADLAWSADGSHLAFVAGEIRTGLYAVEVAAETLDGADRLGPEDGAEGVSWSAVTALGAGRLATVETCCGVPNVERWTVIAVSLADGTVEGELLDGDRVEAAHLDSSPSQEDLVAVTGLRPSGGTLVSWSPGADDPELRQLRDDVIVAAA